MKCKCGCEGKADWLVSGYDYNPEDPNGKGKKFVDEPCCLDAMLYMMESGAELDLPVNKKPITEMAKRYDAMWG